MRDKYLSIQLFFLPGLSQRPQRDVSIAAQETSDACLLNLGRWPDLLLCSQRRVGHKHELLHGLEELGIAARAQAGRCLRKPRGLV